MLTVIILTLLTIITCYAHILKTIHDVKEDNSSVKSQIDSMQHTNIERKTLNKVLTYTLVFLIQYIPLMISDICEFLKVNFLIISCCVIHIYTILFKNKNLKMIDLFNLVVSVCCALRSQSVR